MAMFCTTINKLPEFSIIAGTRETLDFECVYSNGEPIDLTSATAKWTFCPYGQPNYPIATLDGDIYDTNKFVVSLDSEATKNLSGIFTHQPIIIDYAGNEYRFAQGQIVISPEIIY